MTLKLLLFVLLMHTDLVRNRIGLKAVHSVSLKALDMSKILP